MFWSKLRCKHSTCLQLFKAAIFLRRNVDIGDKAEPEGGVKDVISHTVVPSHLQEI